MAIGARQVVFTLTGPDQVGIVHAVSGVITEQGCNWEDSQQFVDPGTERFFMRVVASLPDGFDAATLHESLETLHARFEMELNFHLAGQRAPILVAVSRIGHCLHDLLYRQATDALPARIAAVVSNHPDFASMVEAYDIPFHYLPVSNENRHEQEAEIERIAAEHEVELIVLARYMQVLTPEFVGRVYGKAINIHHGFLPSFKGARPYQQAYERGVKLIGATAHFVTTDLDEGPIIEQEVSRVDHRSNPADLTRIGQDLECIALSGAVGSFLEHRVMLNGNRTVVFR